MAIENANTIEEGRSKIETVFSIPICRPTGDKWQSKTLFLPIYDPNLSIVDYFFDCRLPIVITGHYWPANEMTYSNGVSLVGQ